MGNAKLSPVATVAGPAGMTYEESLSIVTNPWVRNASWPALPVLTDADTKFAALHAVHQEGGNFCSLSAAGAYTVDWGDGTVENFATGVQANHEYDFNNVALANTNAPVTLTDAGDLVTRVAHGYTAGMPISFYNIVSTTGLAEAAIYYVINTTANTFQVAATVGGAALLLTTNGTATLLAYKIAQPIVTVQAGQALTSLNFSTFHPQVGLASPYATGWLDMVISGASISTLTIGVLTAPVRNAFLEMCTIVKLGNVTALTYLFHNCFRLERVALALPVSVLNYTAMFKNCYNLQAVPALDLSGASNLSNLFADCRRLVSVGLLKLRTGGSVSLGGMFINCYSLQTIPLLDTGTASTTATMFSACSNLKLVPLLNLGAVTDTSNMFSGCSSLVTVPLFNISSVTNASSMFIACLALTAVPLFNLASAADLDNMFGSCSSLRDVPLFNTPVCTRVVGMFTGCSSLKTLPKFNMGSVTILSGFVSECPSLTSLPAFNWGAVTVAATSVFTSDAQLSAMQALGLRVSLTLSNCKLAKTAIQEICANLGAALGTPTLTLLGNYGVDNEVTKTGLVLTAQSKLVPVPITAGLAIGMFVTGTGMGITAPFQNVTSDVVLNTLGLVNHGLPNGTKVALSALGSTTGVVINTRYFVVNSTANTFQLALTAGGAAIDLTGVSGTVAVRYASYIVALDLNVSITLSTPAASMQAATSLTFRNLDTAEALLKGWAVNY